MKIELTPQGLVLVESVVATRLLGIACAICFPLALAYGPRQEDLHWLAIVIFGVAAAVGLWIFVMSAATEIEVDHSAGIMRLAQRRLLNCSECVIPVTDIADAQPLKGWNAEGRTPWYLGLTLRDGTNFRLFRDGLDDYGAIAEAARLIRLARPPVARQPF